MAPLLFGLLLLVVGSTGLYIRGKRKFNRRNAAGLEGFKSYRSSVATNFMESALGAASIIVLAVGGFLSIGGIIMLLLRT